MRIHRPAFLQRNAALHIHSSRPSGLLWTYKTEILIGTSAGLAISFGLKYIVFAIVVLWICAGGQ